MRIKLSVILLFSIFFIGAPLITNAQKKSDKLKIVNGAFKNKYYKGVWHISKDRAYKLLSENGEAYNLVIKGEKLQKTGSAIAFVGGALIGYSLGSAAAGAEDPRWFVAGIGGGLALLSLPIYSTGKKKVQMGVEVYNEGLKTAYIPQKRFIDKVSIVGTETGIGLRATF
ncbi:MAG: hypothetical protein C0599_10105 [Salinivirgaceae bacterium]|nr:MAG: hypothetical protein C0599_10105 [Salinivirgaceae bacterium]